MQPIGMIGIYLRVSSNRQDFESQIKNIFDYCLDKKYLTLSETMTAQAFLDPPSDFPLRIYKDDGISGKDLNRPAIQQLLADATNGLLSKVITFEMSRLSRDVFDTMQVMSLLDSMNIVVESPNEGVIKFDNPLNQFLVAVKGFVAAQERQRIRERVKAGIAAAKAKGKVFGAKVGERRKLGYRKVYDKALVLKLKSLRKSGLNFQKISEATDLPRSTVIRILKRNT